MLEHGAVHVKSSMDSHWKERTTGLDQQRTEQESLWIAIVKVSDLQFWWWNKDLLQLPQDIPMK